MIRQFSDYDGDINETADVCVIGSGAGGAVAAKELAQKGYSVVLLEEGGHHTRETWNGKPFRAMVDMFRNGGGTFTLGIPTVSITLGKCIGGTTTINSLTCFRTPPKILKTWRDKLGLAGFTDEYLDPYFEKIEKAIHVTELPWDVLGNCAKIIKRGADSLGLNCRPLKHNALNCRGCGTCQFGCIDGAKQSMDVTYVPEAVNSGARVYANCRAERLTTRNGVITGVGASLINPETGMTAHAMTVRARAIIVACGSLITPSFLKRSGLKNRNIGRNLQIHPGARVCAIMEEKVEGWKGVSQGAYIDDFENEGIILEGIFVHPSILLGAFPFIGLPFKELAAQYAHVAAFAAMIHDTTAGRVYRSGPGGILSTYFINRHDIELLKKGVAYVAKIFFAAGARKVLTAFRQMPVLDSPDDVKRLLDLRVKPGDNHEAMAFHPLGTCRMGSSPKTGAVDSNGESFNVKNLYIADGSVVPTSLGVNPQITIMALANHIADRVAERLGRPA